MSDRSLFSLIMRPLTTGLLALLPVGLTVAIVAWLVNFLADMLGPRSEVGAMLQRVGWSFGESDLGAYAGGMLFALVLIYLLGLLVSTVLKDRWGRWTDGLTSRIPVIRTVYDASKKIVEMMEPKQGTDMQSMQPIMCVPKDAVSPLDCGIDGLFNIYMSMGTMVPDYLQKTPSQQ